MRATTLLAIWIASWANCSAGELSLESISATHHFEDERFNQRHAGVGASLRLDDGSGISVGHYRNSQDRRSRYVSAFAHLPAGRCSFRYGAIIADGYPEIPDFGDAEAVAVPVMGIRCGPIEMLVFSFAVAVSFDVPLVEW